MRNPKFLGGPGKEGWDVKDKKPEVIRRPRGGVGERTKAFLETMRTRDEEVKNEIRGTTRKKSPVERRPASVPTTAGEGKSPRKREEDAEKKEEAPPQKMQKTKMMAGVSPAQKIADEGDWDEIKL